MQKNRLALFGGVPVLGKPLSSYNSIGKEEVRAVQTFLERVQKGDVLLSGFLGRAGDRFKGGPEVRKLEQAFAKKIKVRHAVSFNSATTALQAAVAALGVGPGDEVITSPFTMPATATAILLNGAVPVFADISPETYCITAESISKCITSRTKAILSVNIFGGPADYESILILAKKHNLKIIEDSAQAPGAKYRGKFTGTIGDIGIFSFNVHKTIQAGEGGMLVTNNKKYAYRAELVRNHGEAVEDDLALAGEKNLEYIAGSNYRLTELQAVMMSEQLKKLDTFNKQRIILADYLTKRLKDFLWIKGVSVLPKSTHVYYLYPIRFLEKKAGFSRAAFATAMKAEGFAMQEGYQHPLYLAPIYQKKRIYPDSQFPFISKEYPHELSYGKGICPVVEQMYEKEILVTRLCQPPSTKKTIDLFIKALQKIETNRKFLID